MKTTSQFIFYLSVTTLVQLLFCSALSSCPLPLSEWPEPTVPLTAIHRCHVLDYEHQLPSIILSHCHYSLQPGSGLSVTYDLSSLEKHILDQFFLGKPTILVDIPHVVYRKDVYTVATFAAIREKVWKQVREDCSSYCYIVILFCG